MGTIRISGPTIKEMPLRSVLRRTGGNEYERRWWGLAASVGAFKPPGDPDEVTYDQQPGSAVAVKTARYTGQPTGEEEAVETMTLAFTDSNFPIAQNPSFIDIPGARVKEIADFAKAGEGFETETASPAERDLYDALLEEDTSYRAKLAVVTWNRTVSTSYGTAIDLSGVGAIWTTTQVADSVGAPILFTIPPANVGIKQDTANDFQLGWFKDAAVDFDGAGKVILRQSYEYGLWRKTIYPAYIPAT